MKRFQPLCDQITNSHNLLQVASTSKTGIRAHWSERRMWVTRDTWKRMKAHCDSLLWSEISGTGTTVWNAVPRMRHGGRVLQQARFHIALLWKQGNGSTVNLFCVKKRGAKQEVLRHISLFWTCHIFCPFSLTSHTGFVHSRINTPFVMLRPQRCEKTDWLRAKTGLKESQQAQKNTHWRDCESWETCKQRHHFSVRWHHRPVHSTEQQKWTQCQWIFHSHFWVFWTSQEMQFWMSLLKQMHGDTVSSFMTMVPPLTVDFAIDVTDVTTSMHFVFWQINMWHDMMCLHWTMPTVSNFTECWWCLVCRQRFLMCFLDKHVFKGDTKKFWKLTIHVFTESSILTSECILPKTVAENNKKPEAAKFT